MHGVLYLPIGSYSSIFFIIFLPFGVCIKSMPAQTQVNSVPKQNRFHSTAVTVTKLPVFRFEFLLFSFCCILLQSKDGWEQVKITTNSPLNTSSEVLQLYAAAPIPVVGFHCNLNHA